MKQVRNKRIPTLEVRMACHKVKYGYCSRCGSVGETHFAKPWLEDRKNKERLQSVHAFFSKKTKFPTPSQLKRQRRLF